MRYSIIIPQDKIIAEQEVFRVKQYIKDKKVWVTPNLCKDGFEFEIQVLKYHPYDTDKVRESVVGQDIGTPNSYRGLVNVHAEEWTNSLHFGNPGIFADPPKTRQEAVERYRQKLEERYIKGKPHPWLSFNGHFTCHHYAGEFGFDCIGSEIGCLIKNNQMQMAFNRGAARQYHLPWMIDVSPWYDDFSMLDYSGCSIWGVASGPDFGHSLSYIEREYYLAYMSGATQITAEAAGITAFYPEENENGHYKLSPHGELCKSFYEFTKRNPDIGIPYTPFALFLDLYHGCNYGSPFKGKAFEVFPYERGDWFTYNLMDLFYKGGCWETWDRPELGSLGASPYGDSLDVLVQTASLEVMQSYPVLILSGCLSLSDAEREKVYAYVENGGTLVMNAAYTEQLPKYTDSGDYGAGRVIRFGPDWSIHGLRNILPKLAEEYLPFTVSGNVDYMVNVKENSLILTVMNHEGITKMPRELPEVDLSKTQMVNVLLKEDAPLASVRELYADTALPTMAQQNLLMEPGAIRILEFTFQ